MSRIDEILEFVAPLDENGRVLDLRKLAEFLEALEIDIRLKANLELEEI